VKLVQTNRRSIGLLVDLPAGPHVLDLAKSLGVFAHDPVSSALITSVMREKFVWVALVNHWQFLRKPLALLARTALGNPDDPCLVLRPFAEAQQTGESLHGIVALDITDAADLESDDPAGRLAMTEQLAEPVVEPAERDAASLGENVQVVDFLRRDDPRNRHE
jgi:hypothetical protein